MAKKPPTQKPKKPARYPLPKEKLGTNVGELRGEDEG